MNWLLALTHHIRELLDTGKVKGFAEVARRGHITRARMTQIMNLLLLAPDIQKEILFLPPTTKGKDPITPRSMLPVRILVTWRQQRCTWAAMCKRL